jgi:nicotinamide mononucleotide transporter
MMTVYQWALANWIEVCGMLTGFIYLWFSVRQSIFTWPLGILSSLLYIIVFFNARFYAGMGLQFYYFFISIYGWWSWMHPNSGDTNGKELRISRTDKKLWIAIIMICILLFALIAVILRDFTDSPIPYWDSFTTSLSIVATWMLARKKFEHWLLWMLIDSVSIILYIFRGLYPTTILFVGYSIMAVVGFIEWQKELKKKECQKTLLNEL